PAVEARFAFPGPHLLALWKHVCLGWLGDASRAEFALPWRLAPHLLTPAGGAPPERFAPVIRLEFDGDPLTLVERDTSDYNAGSPAVGEVWVERGGQRLKLESPPAAGARLIAHVVPLFRCVVAAEDVARQYRAPGREPRKSVLLQAAESAHRRHRPPARTRRACRPRPGHPARICRLWIHRDTFRHRGARRRRVLLRPLALLHLRRQAARRVDSPHRAPRPLRARRVDRHRGRALQL